MPDLIPGTSPKAAQINQPDIYNTNKDNRRKNQTENELKVLNITKNTHEDNDNLKSNIDTECSRPETENSYILNPSSNFTLNCNTKFLINEELIDNGSPSLRQSNSFKTSDHLNNSAENKQESPKTKTITPQKRVIDIPISLKTSSQRTSTDEVDGTPPSTEQQSNSFRTLSENYQTTKFDNQTSSPSSTPNGKIKVERQPIPQRKIPANQENVASSPSSSVIKNLFSIFGSKVSGSGLNDEDDTSKEKPTPKIESKLIYEISPEEFKECDHRLKLYFEVSLFTGGQEELLNCLIKVCTWNTVG